MPDSFTRLRKGEKRPLYGQISAATGTLTIAGTPTCTLFDLYGSGMAGLIGINVTGFDSGALASSKAWYLLDTAALSVGWYTLVFYVGATGSDGILRTFEPSIEINVIAVDG